MPEEMKIGFGVGPDRNYKPTGQWEVVAWYNSNYERDFYALVRPDGTPESVWHYDGFHEARGYADTYNMNEDKAPEFRTCPFCGGAMGQVRKSRKKNCCVWCS